MIFALLNSQRTYSFKMNQRVLDYRSTKSLLKPHGNTFPKNLKRNARYIIQEQHSMKSKHIYYLTITAREQH